MPHHPTGCHFTKHKFKDKSIKNIEMVLAKPAPLSAVGRPEGRPGSQVHRSSGTMKTHKERGPQKPVARKLGVGAGPGAWWGRNEEQGASCFSSGETPPPVSMVRTWAPHLALSEPQPKTASGSGDEKLPLVLS